MSSISDATLASLQIYFVSHCFRNSVIFVFFILSCPIAMGTASYAIVCPTIACLCVAKYTKNIWKSTNFSICHIYCGHIHHTTIHRRNDCKNPYSWHLEGEYTASRSNYMSNIVWVLMPKISTPFVENTSKRCTIFTRSLVSIWCKHAYIFVDIGDITDFPIAGNCFTILVLDSLASTATTHYDSIFACVFEIFHAKKPYQPDFQVSFYLLIGQSIQSLTKNCFR